MLTGEKGTQLLIDFENPVTLQDGDGLVLDDGSVVVVSGMPEPLAEIAASSPREFVRLARHLGNRHTDVQITGSRIRMRRDHVLEEMLRGLGATVRLIDAPFEPHATVPHRSWAWPRVMIMGTLTAQHHAHRHGHDHER